MSMEKDAVTTVMSISMMRVHLDYETQTFDIRRTTI